MLDAALSLADYPYDEAMGHHGEARSRSCGSTLAVSLELAADGRIAAVGLRPHACAIGQAAISVFSAAAVGRARSDIALAKTAIAHWLAGEGPLPDWPGIELIAAAAAYPARHGAVLLAWDAALAAMPAPPLERPRNGGDD